MNKAIAVLGLSFLLLLLAVFSTPVWANTKQEVLGQATPSSDFSIPPTVEGPGLILPDSPLFFLDQLKQQARLAMSFTPEARLKIRASIAGERLAELRIMLARDSSAGVETDLRGIQDNVGAAADEVRNVRLSGRTVVDLAKNTNDTFKRIRASLDALESQSTGSVRSRVRVAQDALQEAKVIVDDALPAMEKDNEIQEDLSRLAQRRVMMTTEATADLERQLQALQEKRDMESEKAIARRSEEAKIASGTATQKMAQTALENEKKKQGRVHTLTQQAIDTAKQSLENAEKAATTYIQLEQLIQTLRNTPADQLVSTASAK